MAIIGAKMRQTAGQNAQLFNILSALSGHELYYDFYKLQSH